MKKYRVTVVITYSGKFKEFKTEFISASDFDDCITSVKNTFKGKSFEIVQVALF